MRQITHGDRSLDPPPSKTVWASFGEGGSSRCPYLCRLACNLHPDRDTNEGQKPRQSAAPSHSCGRLHALQPHRQAFDRGAFHFWGIKSSVLGTRPGGNEAREASKGERASAQ